MKGVKYESRLMKFCVLYKVEKCRDRVAPFPRMDNPKEQSVNHVNTDKDLIGPEIPCDVRQEISQGILHCLYPTAVYLLSAHNEISEIFKLSKKGSVRSVAQWDFVRSQ